MTFVYATGHCSISGATKPFRNTLNRILGNISNVRKQLNKGMNGKSIFVPAERNPTAMSDRRKTE